MMEVDPTPFPPTGMTRARRELHVAGSAVVIEAALGRHASRWSGLGWRLGSESLLQRT